MGEEMICEVWAPTA